MTLLQIIQRVTGLIGLPRPTQVIGNTDQTVISLLAHIHEEGEALGSMRNSWGGGWSVLEKEHTFATVASQAEYDLPADFSELIGNTVWNRSTFFEVRGPLSPQEWQAIKSGLSATPALRHRYRIKRTAGTGKDAKVFIDPTPAQVETLVFEYRTDRWISNAAGDTFKTEFTADDDEPLFPDRLIRLGAVWRFKEAKGFAFAGALAQYEIERDKAFAADGGTTAVSIAKRRFRLPRANVPETGFGP